MVREENRNQKIHSVAHPIRRSMLRASILFALALCILLGALSFFMMSGTLYRQYNDNLREIVAYVEHHTDADDLLECMRTGEHSEKYDALQEFLNGMIDDLGLEYLYLVIPGETYMTNAISATSAAEFARGEDNMPLLETTDAYSAQELQRFRSCWDAEDITFFRETSDYGVYYTAVKPLRGSDGETVALICADASIPEMHRNLWTLIGISVGSVIAACVVFSLVMNAWLRRRVTDPLLALKHSTERFAEESHNAQAIDQMHYELPDIHTGNELQSLAEAIGQMADDVRERAEEIVDAQRRAEQAEEENRRLAAEAASSARIASLSRSLQTMFLNMPGLTFSKDAETGRYIACNQRFAAYANRSSPDGVIGLTDSEIFDAATAQHFLEGDRKALESDAPIVFYEVVQDAAGHQRHLQTTKLRYTDRDGRPCTLGMSVDVTDLFNSRQETQETKRAYEKARSSSVTYAHIAQALAVDYAHLYYVDLDTDHYIEYRSDAQEGKLAVEYSGEDFFRASHNDAQTLLYKDDLPIFLQTFRKEIILAALDQHGAFSLTYRQLVDGAPTYMHMKVTRMSADNRHIIIGVSNVDAQVRYQEAAERALEERTTYARITALSGDYLAIYTVDPETDRYTQYNASREYKDLGLEIEGEDFFTRARTEAMRMIHPDDLLRFDSMFTKENILKEVRQNGVYVLTYRLMMNGTPAYVSSKAALVQEKDGPQLIIGVQNVDAQTRREQEYQHNLTVARVKANVDALTGVRNKHAYIDAEAELNRRIVEEHEVHFAITALDVNNLKQMNDTNGHAAGDKLLKQASAVICNIFSHSPVFRVGGDEFIVISQGEDYERIDELLDKLRRSNEENADKDLPVVAAGMARFDGDKNVEAVFERADRKMYVEKKRLKKE